MPEVLVVTWAAGVRDGASGPAARPPSALLVHPPIAGARAIEGLCSAPGAGGPAAAPSSSRGWALTVPPLLVGSGGSGRWPGEGGWGGEAGEAAPGDSPSGPVAEALVMASVEFAGGRARALAEQGPGAHLAQGSLPPGGAGGRPLAGAEGESGASGGGGVRRGRQAAAPPAQGSAVKNGSGEEPEGVALAGPGWEASPKRTPRYPPHPGRGAPQLRGRGPGSCQCGEVQAGLE